MKRREKSVEEFVLRHMGWFKAPQEQMDLAEARIQDRLHSAAARMTKEQSVESGADDQRWKLKRLALVFGAAAAAVVLVVFLQMPRAIDAHAVVESADGSLSRISGGMTQLANVGERIEAGEILRTNSGGGSITLADGSRVEMRSAAEFSIEHTDDGVRIHLRKGRLIVRAAKQVAGHLYVETRDVTVSVVGTVFLVNAEKEGSSVAVIEGEVRVQHGATSKNLLPGEQLSTNPQMEPLAVKEEISWSRNEATHVAVLQPTAAAPPASTSQNPPEARVAFEVVSIRPSVPLPTGGRGGPAGGAPPAVAAPPEADLALQRMLRCGGPGGGLQVSPGRFVVTNATVYRLIVLAYGLKNCALAIQLGLVSGGPDWANSDRFDIQATMPEGSPSYTQQQLNSGEAPKLQQMIQTLLAERFKLALRREMKEIPAYNLVVAKAGKVKPSEDQNPPGPPVPGQGFRPNALPRGVMLNCAGNAISVSSMANCFQGNVGRPITDKTELKGLFDFPPLSGPDAGAPQGAAYAPLFLEQFGLKLELTTAPVEALTIARVEKPTEN